MRKLILFRQKKCITFCRKVFSLTVLKKIRVAAVLGVVVVVLVAMGALFTITSCKNLSSETALVTFRLPKWPPENASKNLYPPLVFWRVSWYDGSCHVQNVAATATNVDVPAKRNLATAFVVQPVTLHEDTSLVFFNSAGCIYPYSATATWEDGWTAAVALETAKKCTDETYMRFNWEKFIISAKSKMAKGDRDYDVQVNPWYFDTAKNADAIAKNIFPPSNFNNPSKRYFATVNDVFGNSNDFGGQETHFLSQYIPEQKQIDEKGEIFLRWQKPVYFLVSENKLASKLAFIDKRSKTSVKISIYNANDENTIENFRLSQ